jgi:hypothetical protein
MVDLYKLNPVATLIPRFGHESVLVPVSSWLAAEPFVKYKVQDNANPRR